MDNFFVYPYSNNGLAKREEIWRNLQTGLLFEDNEILISWLTPYSELRILAEKVVEKGDRTNWFLGQHIILDGYNCTIGVMKWSFVSNLNPISEIEEFLGFDYDGNNKFIFLKNKLTDLLGEPNTRQLEKFGDFDLGLISWTNGKVRIALSGIEQFACKYRLYIGLTTATIR